MLIAAIKPGHDGSVALVEDHRLLYSLEAEKDSLPRYSELSAVRLLELMELADRPPDVLAVGGWLKGAGRKLTGAGYGGPVKIPALAVPLTGPGAFVSRGIKLSGHKMQYFSSSHERSHLMMAMGMAPPEPSPSTVVLVWEGSLGAFYILDEHWQVTETIQVLAQPGDRYAFLFDLADPAFAEPRYPRAGSAGKLMALAAYGNPGDATPEIASTVDRIMSPRTRRISTSTKWDFRDSPLFNAGVESAATKTAAAILGDQIFTIFADVARDRIPAGLPLRISGGCGLNCEWNRRWRELGHFSSVFVPPCANDSGSAIGTAIDAALFYTGRGHIDWNVYAGLDFDLDTVPPEDRWQRVPLDYAQAARDILGGHITAWARGAWEIGPRALGNRSLLASPFDPASHDRLNEIKQREGYRPIAPVCREEDLGQLFDATFDDPYMLYFRTVTTPSIPAVTHVDGTARAQTVRRDQNPPLHRLLTSVAGITGTGILCNTSLNWKGMGFINRLSDLVQYCEKRGITRIVAGDWRYLWRGGEAR